MRHAGRQEGQHPVCRGFVDNTLISSCQCKHRHLKLAPREELAAPDLASFLTFDDAGFRQFFSGSPIKRVGRDRFVRNCLYAAGNSGSAALAPLVEWLRGDPDPAVSEAADWAARRLG